MDPISATNAFSSALNSDNNALFSAVGGSSNFSSIFSQAMSAAKTPGQKAMVEYDQARFSDLNALYSMGDGSSDSSSNLSSFAGLASLMGSGSPFAAPPAWETQLASLLGPDSTAAQALNLDQQASLASQSLLNGGLSSLGSSIDSLF
jgi:hypothetical protein